MELNEIEKIFYENFTKRQDSNNDFLLRLLIIVGSVIAGYAYLLFKIDAVDVDKDTMFFIVVFTEILLMIYFKIIYDDGFAFRRDQLVVFRILRKHGLISEKEEDDSNHNIIFTYYYNPLKKHDYTNEKVKKKSRKLFFLMPAFHNTLASSILVIQLTVYLSFCMRFNDLNYTYVLVTMLIANVFIDLYIVDRKRKWLEELYKSAFEANKQH